jgi:hypothetical protein
MIAIYMLAAFGAAWQYCSYRRINLPLLKITFCFHTASAELSSTVIISQGEEGYLLNVCSTPELGHTPAVPRGGFCYIGFVRARMSRVLVPT